MFLGAPALLVDVFPEVAQGRRRRAALGFLRLLCHVLQIGTLLNTSIL